MKTSSFSCCSKDEIDQSFKNAIGKLSIFNKPDETAGKFRPSSIHGSYQRYVHSECFFFLMRHEIVLILLVVDGSTTFIDSRFVSDSEMSQSIVLLVKILVLFDFIRDVLTMMLSSLDMDS